MAIYFALRIPFCILPADKLAAALSQAPPWWGVAPDAKHNAIFVISPKTAPEICRLVGDAKPKYEQIACGGNVIFWSAPLKTFSRTRWSKVVENKEAYAHITIRNENTTRKLLTMAQEMY